MKGDIGNKCVGFNENDYLCKDNKNSWSSNSTTI